MKARPHHNNKGYRRTKRDKRPDEVMQMAKRLGIPYDKGRLIIEPVRPLVRRVA